MIKSRQGALALTAALALLAGCQTSPPLASPAAALAPGPAGTAAAAGATPPAATPSGTSQSRVATVDLARSPAGTSEAAAATSPSSRGAAAAGTAMLAAPSQRVVYFDFDSFAIKDDYKGLIDGHARALASAKGKRVVIEGHADERGGREYNLALGQKRAEAVVKSLTLLGVAPGQLEAVSFGEERPAVQGSDESAWSRNRRAELKDR